MKNQKLPNKEIRKQAALLGFKEYPGKSHEQLIFRRRTTYISYDLDGHNGGFWKVASSPKNLRTKSSRSYTADKWLNKIGD